MKFSIITVCRESVQVLPRAMASLARQTCGDYEWVVVDGASHDGTAELAQTFTAAPLQCVSEPDGGIYDAMNKGVALARGDYLYFLNSDDTLADAQVLERAKKAVDDEHLPDLLIGRVIIAGPDGRSLRDFSHLTRSTVLFDSLCHQAVFAHRGLFSRFGVFDTRYLMAADFDWLARVVRGGARALHVPYVVAEFSAGGAHAQAMRITHAETMHVRRAHTTASELVWTHALAWCRHKTRRLFGLRPRGRLARHELDSLGFPPRSR